MFSDYAAPITLRSEEFEIVTKSAGLVVLFLAVWLGVEALRHPIQTGKHAQETPVYDPPRVGSKRTTVKCVECGANIPRLAPICPECGHKRPLY